MQDFPVKLLVYS